MPTKLNVEFTDQQRKLLDEMAEDLGTTKAGVLRTALALLQVAVREKKEGNQVGIIRDNKVLKEIVGL